MRNIVLFIFSLFLFTACSTKQVNNTNETKTQIKTETTQVVQSDDEEFDDFEEEFEEEVQQNDFDPLEGYNRVMTTFNDYVYLNVLDPIASGYKYVVPTPVRTGVSNVFDNLLFPVRFSNNLLQLKFANATEELGRFVVNSIWGIAGIMDPAKTELGWEEHDEDFGQTLGYWGVGEGFHVVLPILGPSNLRDMVGLVGDSYVSPLNSTGQSDLPYKLRTNAVETAATFTLRQVNQFSFTTGQYKNLTKDSVDLYPLLKSVYNQRRENQIKE